MSAILKALKKLEQETAENAGVPLNGSVKGRPQKQPGKRPGSLVVPGLIAFTLCIFAGIGILIYTQNISVLKSTSPESPVVLKKDENAVLPEKIPVEKTPSQSRPSEVVTQKPITRKPVKPVLAAPEFEFATAGMSIADQSQANEKVGVQELPGAQPQKVTPERLTAQPRFDYATAPVKLADPFTPIMPEPDVLNKNSVLTEEDPEPAAVFQSEVVADESSVPDLPDTRKYSFTEKPVANKTEPPIAVIEDASVELQAISWSADAAKRMAIINGKICREKDRVAGYVIQAINSDDVIVSKGSEKGKIVFKIR